MELNELQVKWLDALRNGERQQCRGSLSKVAIEGQNRFCCLGVFADVRGVTWSETTNSGADDNDFRRSFRLDDADCGSTHYLPESWLSKLGLTVVDQYQLSALNDSYRLSFKEIADRLEAFWRSGTPLID